MCSDSLNPVCARIFDSNSSGVPWNLWMVCVSSPPTRLAKKRSFSRKTPRSSHVVSSATSMPRSSAAPSSWPLKICWTIPTPPSLESSGDAQKPRRRARSIPFMVGGGGNESKTFCAPAFWPLLEESWKAPLKGFTVWTLLGSARSRVARRSPAATIAPAPSVWWIFPETPDRSDMIIFMASSSAKGSPSLISAPSACKYRTSFPLKSERNSEGSRILGKVMVAWPSTRNLRHRGSSTPEIWATASPHLTYSEPSGCSRKRASSIVSPMVSAKASCAVRETWKLYLVKSCASSTWNDCRIFRLFCKGM
mmetsp:Transcript_43997/g.110540  ORF Transcript_43997/g.110540 Transcript_43997/m.110540 type:complete len:308 (+) Transcript_43997:1875-2798(+)